MLIVSTMYGYECNRLYNLSSPSTIFPRAIYVLNPAGRIESQGSPAYHAEKGSFFFIKKAETKYGRTSGSVRALSGHVLIFQGGNSKTAFKILTTANT